MISLIVNLLEGEGEHVVRSVAEGEARYVKEMEGRYVVKEAA